jgi:hypothetical protein
VRRPVTSRSEGLELSCWEGEWGKVSQTWIAFMSVYITALPIQNFKHDLESAQHMRNDIFLLEYTSVFDFQKKLLIESINKKT